MGRDIFVREAAEKTAELRRMEEALPTREVAEKTAELRRMEEALRNSRLDRDSAMHVGK
ncbi:hypothetical protein T484DRAFT_1824589, partial [Baffinella frigidus]